MSLNVRSGGVWRTVTHAWARSGGVWRDCTAVFVRSGGVWRQVFSLGVISAIAGTYNGTRTTGANSIATLVIRRDGTWQGTHNGSTGLTVSPSGNQNWCTPPAANSGDTRWVQVTTTSGDAAQVNPATSPVALTSDRTITLTALAGESLSGVHRVRIWGDAGGTVLLSDGNVTLAGTR